MMWFFICLLALLVGFAMFARLQPDLPDELSFLKPAPTSGLVVTTDQDPNAGGAQALPDYAEATAGWKLQVVGQDRELSKDFNEAIAGPNGQTYDKPTLYLTCYQGQLFARINTRMRVAGDQPVQMNVAKMPGWKEAEQQNWYSSNAAALVSQMVARKSVQVQLQFAEVGTQRFTFNAIGIPTVAKNLAPCRL